MFLYLRFILISVSGLFFLNFFWYVTLKQNVIWILGFSSSPFLHSHLRWILMTWMECTFLLIDFELANISCFDYQNEVEVLVLSIEVWGKYALVISMVQGEWKTCGADLVLYVKQNHPNWFIEQWKQVLIVCVISLHGCLLCTIFLAVANWYTF